MKCWWQNNKNKPTDYFAAGGTVCEKLRGLLSSQTLGKKAYLEAGFKGSKCQRVSGEGRGVGGYGQRHGVMLRGAGSWVLSAGEEMGGGGMALRTRSEHR